MTTFQVTFIPNDAHTMHTVIDVTYAKLSSLKKKSSSNANWFWNSFLLQYKIKKNKQHFYHTWLGERYSSVK